VHGSSRRAAPRTGAPAPDPTPPVDSSGVTAPAGAIAPERLPVRWLVLGFVLLAASVTAGVALGAVSLPPQRVALELLDRLPLVDVDSGLSPRDAAIVWDLRFPRVVLGLLVGATLAICGASYQGAFRNPLVDPYLLGSAAGAGLGATIAIVNGVSRSDGVLGPLPLAAFAGALTAVAMTYVLGASADRGRNSAALVLAGVAVTSFLTALQTYVQQRHAEIIQQVYNWILGRLGTAGWTDVAVLTPYVVVTSVVLLAHRRVLDVLAVGDEEAATLGVSVERARLTVVVAATLGTAAAVSVSGLIAFVGIIVPHTVRLLVGRSYRIILPLSLLFGGAFLVLADLVARTVISPAELPIGVVTAFFGAPFFLIVLRTSRRGAL
jgi:iron complex transport system permease protein